MKVGTITREGISLATFPKAGDKICLKKHLYVTPNRSNDLNIEHFN